jgi:hypothetical protein
VETTRVVFVSVLALLGLAALPLYAQETKLFSDPRLQQKITLDLKTPTVGEVLRSLRETTKLTLTVDERNVDQRGPAFGSLSLRNMPAWSVMEQLAKSKAVQGYWVKTDDGYRLVGTVKPSVEVTAAKSAGAEEDSKESRLDKLLLVIAVMTLGIAALFVVRFWQRGKSVPSGQKR